MESESKDNSISFRLPPDVYRWLVTMGDQAGIKKHLMARTIIIQTFHAGKDPDRLKALEAIEDELAALRQALARGVAAVLQNVTELSEETVHDWVTKRMLRDAGDGGDDDTNDNDTDTDTDNNDDTDTPSATEATED